MEYLAILYSVGGGIPFAVVEFIRYPVVFHSLIKKDLTSDRYHPMLPVHPWVQLGPLFYIVLSVCTNPHRIP